jgi:hypothetical protein
VRQAISAPERRPLVNVTLRGAKPMDDVRRPASRALMAVVVILLPLVMRIFNRSGCHWRWIDDPAVIA